MSVFIRGSSKVTGRTPKQVKLVATFTAVKNTNTVTFNMSTSSLLSAYNRLNQNAKVTAVTWVVKRPVTIAATAALTTPEVFCGMLERMADDRLGYVWPQTTEYLFPLDGVNNSPSKVKFYCDNFVNARECQFARNRIPSIRGNFPTSIAGFIGLNDQNAQADRSLDNLGGYWGADEKPMLCASQAGGTTPLAGDPPATEYVTIPLTIHTFNGKETGVLLASMVQGDKPVQLTYKRVDRTGLYTAGSAIDADATIELWLTIEVARAKAPQVDKVFVGMPWYMLEDAVPTGVGFQDIPTSEKDILRCVGPRFDGAATDTGRLAGYAPTIRYIPPVFDSWWNTNLKVEYQEDLDGVLTTTFPEDQSDLRTYQGSLYWNQQYQGENGRGRDGVLLAASLLPPPVGENAPVYTSATAGTALAGTAANPIARTQWVTHNRQNLDVAQCLGEFSAHPIFPLMFVTNLATFPGLAVNGGDISCASRFKFSGAALTFPDTQLTRIRVRPELMNIIAAAAKCANACTPDGQLVDRTAGAEKNSPNVAAITDYVSGEAMMPLLKGAGNTSG